VRLYFELEARTDLPDELVQGLLVLLQVLVHPKVDVDVVLLVDGHPDIRHNCEAEIELGLQLRRRLLEELNDDRHVTEKKGVQQVGE